MLATLDDGQVLMVHLGMTGRLVLEPKSAPPKRHMHLAVRLAGLQAELRFYDARRFGRVGLGSLDWLASRTGLGRLGREPLDAGRGEVAAALRLGGGRIKATMLGQEVVAGLGNIYADEALFRAGIHPLRRCASLSVAESLCLESCIIRVLREAVAAGGSTIGDYVRHDGRSGSYQNSHAVYGRNGQPCPRCGQPICRIMAAGRGTHLCRRCQPRKGEGRARRGTEGISRRRSD
jgi:formamidopyrimidine-DNA glycosylase